MLGARSPSDRRDLPFALARAAAQPTCGEGCVQVCSARASSPLLSGLNSEGVIVTFHDRDFMWATRSGKFSPSASREQPHRTFRLVDTGPGPLTHPRWAGSPAQGCGCPFPIAPAPVLHFTLLRPTGSAALSSVAVKRHVACRAPGDGTCALSSGVMCP